MPSSVRAARNSASSFRNPRAVWRAPNGISKSFGDRVLFAGADLTVNAGDRVGLVGPNGAGKTTLLAIAAGDDSQDSGRRSLARGVRVGMLSQEIDPTQRHTVREEAASALRRLDDLERELRELEERMAMLGRDGDEIPRTLAERYDRIHGSFSAEGGFEKDVRIGRLQRQRLFKVLR